MIKAIWRAIKRCCCAIENENKIQPFTPEAETPPSTNARSQQDETTIKPFQAWMESKQNVGGFTNICLPMGPLAIPTGTSNTRAAPEAPRNQNSFWSEQKKENNKDIIKRTCKAEDAAIPGMIATPRNSG